MLQTLQSLLPTPLWPLDCPIFLDNVVPCHTIILQSEKQMKFYSLEILMLATGPHQLLKLNNFSQSSLSSFQVLFFHNRPHCQAWLWRKKINLFCRNGGTIKSTTTTMMSIQALLCSFRRYHSGSTSSWPRVQRFFSVLPRL